MSLQRKRIISHICGGSIITSTRILTAAHCVSRILMVNHHIVCGVNNPYDLQDSHRQTRDIKRCKVHELYDPITFNSDIAIIELKTSLTLNNWVNTVSLPPPRRPGGYGTFQATGYGSPFIADPGTAIAPFIFDVEAFTDLVCQERYPYKNIENVICTVRHVDSGPSDSGGPLTHGRTQYGIESKGNSLPMNGYPDVYTRVDSFRLWIANSL